MFFLPFDATICSTQTQIKASLRSLVLLATNALTTIIVIASKAEFFLPCPHTSSQKSCRIFSCRCQKISKFPMEQSGIMLWNLSIFWNEPASLNFIEWTKEVWTYGVDFSFRRKSNRYNPAIFSDFLKGLRGSFYRLSHAQTSLLTWDFYGTFLLSRHARGHLGKTSRPPPVEALKSPYTPPKKIKPPYSTYNGINPLHIGGCEKRFPYRHFFLAWGPHNRRQ